MTSDFSIRSIRTQLVSLPLDEPVRGHPFLGARTQFVTLLVRIMTEAGVEGFGYVTANSARQMAAIGTIVHDLADALIGVDALRREYLYGRLWRLTSELLHEGAANLALSAIDIALWDLAGKAAGMPLYRLLGGYREEVPTYASQSLWRHQTLDELERNAVRLVEQGFRAMKLRLGGRPVAEDVERARVVRRAVGADVRIMTDALWSLTVPDAIRLSRALAEVDIYWFEDPLPEGDPADLARVRAIAGVPVASGERLSNLHQVRRLLEAGAIDHAILDVHHLGGITPWLKAAAFVEERNLPVAAHIAHEIQLHLLAALPHGSWLEYFPYWDALYREPLRPESGLLRPHSRPGLGLELDEAAIEHFAVEI